MVPQLLSSLEDISEENSDSKKGAIVIIDENVYLEHFGILGMRWGVRKKTTPTASTLPVKLVPSGITIRIDGSISIRPGANLQRLVRSNGKSLAMKDVTYASLNAYDNSRYIKKIGGKGFFGGGRDQILSIRATKKIEAPSKEKATEIVSKLMLKDAKFRAKNTNALGVSISKKELEQIRKDPKGKTAKAWYEMTNTKLTFDPSWDPDAPHVQKTLREEFLRRGYNAVRDENDFSTGLSRAPIIIFSPETSLKVTSTTSINNDLRKANKQQLREYDRAGREYIDKQLFAE